MEQLFVAACAPSSGLLLARRVTTVVPASRGTPVIMPFELSDSPAGNELELSASNQVYGPRPPAAWSDLE
jgi:hypothetical protein